MWRAVGFGFATGGATGFGVAGLGPGGLDAAVASDSVFWFEATTGSGFGAALFGRDEPGDNGVAAFRGGVLLTMLCRVQFRCLAGLSAQAST